MLQSASVKLLLFLIAVLGSQALFAQSRIRQVSLEKAPGNAYLVRFRLQAGESLPPDGVQLIIQRRRAGRVSEVFSGPIQPADGSNGMYVYTWQTDAATVRPGDELRATVRLTYERPVTARTAPANNQAPKANAGTFLDLQLPLSSPLTLNAGASSDPDGKIVAYKWRQIGGPTTLQIQPGDSGKALASGNWKEGTYAFELAVRDNRGASDTDRLVVSVRPAAAAPAPPPAVTQAPPPRRDTVAPKLTPPPTVTTALPRMKGGPANAAINLLVPGLGHYYVSGDGYGENRKKNAFIVTGLYLASAGGAAYFKIRSDQQYRKYLELANSRENQIDAGGVVIGVRGPDGTKVNDYLENARSAHRYFLMSAGSALAINAADFLYTLVRGSSNRARWKREHRTSFLLTPQATGWAAGVRIKL